MASFICKMCGGNLELIESEQVCECDHCGRRQTVPKPDDDKKMALFERANQLRADCDFDKAAGIYEAIAAEFTDEAEAYWGLVLCKYGIEYVDDPLTKGKIPTCHRSSFNSVFDDADYKATIENATVVQREVYETEAGQIEALRRGIIEVSEKEEPYDVFICFKEHDAKGDRTPDSVFAQEIYEALTEKGYRVFFSRITLENILGTEYEPYIFAALNSAKVMLAFGTSAEYYNSVWVKNEWSRFLQLIAAGEKKTLIPCYADMPIDEMPQGFSIRQAQNMAKLGWQQDLIRGVEKIIPKEKEIAQEKVIIRESSNNPTVKSLLKRVFIFLEDKDWKSADEYAEKVLDIEPENAEAYLGKLMAELQIMKRQYLNGLAEPFDKLVSYKKVLRYANADLKAELEGYNAAIRKRNKYNAEKEIYDQGVAIMNAAESSATYFNAAKKFEEIPDFENATELARKCRENGEERRRVEIYYKASTLYNSTDTRKILEAKPLFEKIPDYKDAAELAANCEEKAENMRRHLICTSAQHTLDNSIAANLINQAIANLETIPGFENADELREKLLAKKENLAEEIRIAERRKKEAQALAEKERRKKRQAEKNKQLAKILAIVVAVAVVAFVIYFFAWGKPNAKYETAVAHLEAGEYEEAITLFTELKRFRDSEDKLPEAKYQFADYKLENGDVDGAYELFSDIAGYNTTEKKWSGTPYEDSKERRTKLICEHNRLAEVGDVITFGTYEQDNNSDNGKEAIEWIVVSKEDGKLSVISKDYLDSKPFNEGGYKACVWKDSSLRRWLNGEFYKNAFTDEDKAKIVEETLKTLAGKDEFKSTDKVYLLVKTDCDDDEEHKILMENSDITPYARSKADAVKNGIISPDRRAFWLRESTTSPNDYLGATGAYVKFDNQNNESYGVGLSEKIDGFTNSTYAYIRPVISISIENK